MTRVDKLSEKIKVIVNNHEKEIGNLPRKGPKGGTNSAYLQEHWAQTGIGAITMAANKAGCPTMNYWSGSNPTPATSIPRCILEEVEKEYKKLFG